MSKSLNLFFWIALTLLARLIPHPPNLSPYASLILLLGCQLSRRNAVLVTVTSLVLSDIILALLYQYPVFGLWSLFTYSGFIATAIGSYYCLYQRRTALRIAVFALGSVGTYWLWTNFGTWLFGAMYPHSELGLVACFVAGLPFLQMSLLSAVIFVPLFFALISLKERTWALKPH